MKRPDHAPIVGIELRCTADFRSPELKASFEKALRDQVQREVSRRWREFIASKRRAPVRQNVFQLLGVK